MDISDDNAPSLLVPTKEPVPHGKKGGSSLSTVPETADMVVRELLITEDAISWGESKGLEMRLAKLVGGMALPAGLVPTTKELGVRRTL